MKIKKEESLKSVKEADVINQFEIIDLEEKLDFGAWGDSECDCVDATAGCGCGC